MTENKVRYNNKIPTHVGFIFLLVFGLIAAFVTIRIGDRIIQGAPNSKALSENRQLQQMIENTK
jgi:hypothetical protein